MSDTIAAIATPPGRGGVGIVRVSGTKARDICLTLTGVLPPVRVAKYTSFLRSDGSKIDEGLSIFFAGPHSFTGDDVLELHGHGGPVVLDMLLHRVLELGARIARAGEFSERAFLNNKMDLLQAEAVAQLINASTEQAASAAMRSMQGEFSKKINALVERLINLRLYVEAAIDFADEDITFLSNSHVQTSVQALLDDISGVYKQAGLGVLLSEGVTSAIIGQPNVGKSTLLNALTGSDMAIVTPIAGTTRDIIKATISLDGVLLNILDTAGLRNTDDIVEQAGIKKTWLAIESADLIFLVVDGAQVACDNPWDLYPELKKQVKKGAHVFVLYNKIDQLGIAPFVREYDDYSVVAISAHVNTGLDLLRAQIKKVLSVDPAADGGVFLARRRHLDALVRAQNYIVSGQQQLCNHVAGELLAEDLRAAQLALSEITGEFTADDLLGRIFSEFCIGK